MARLKDPPLPKNKNWMAGMAVLIFALAVLAFVLLGDVIEKPKKDTAIQKQIVEIEHQLHDKQEALQASAQKEVSVGNNFDESTAVSDSSSTFSAQEDKLRSETTPEPEYLQDRIWGFWYIMLPLFVVVGVFLYWVRKKHKEWTR